MSERIIIAQGQTPEAIQKETEEIRKEIESIKAIRPYAEINLEKTEEQIHRVGDNLGKIAELEGKFAALEALCDSFIKGREDIAHYGKLSEEIVAFVRELVAQKRYAEAREGAKLLLNKFITLDYGFTLKLQKAIQEIEGHLIAEAYCQENENHIEENTPFDEENLKAYEELIPELGVELDGEKSRYFHADRIIGFRYVDAYRAYEEKIDGPEALMNAVILDGELNKGGLELSEVTQGRRKLFLDLIQSRFDVLSQEAFVGEVYENALFYYEHRDCIDVSLLTRQEYCLPTEEKFHMAFLSERASRMTADEFFAFAKSLEPSIIVGDAFTIRFVSLMLSSEKLPESKFELLAASLAGCGFEALLIVFGKAMDNGLSEERQFSLLSMLIHEKKKVCTLDKVALALLVLDQKLAPSQQKAYGALRRDLLRSPHSKKVIVKSNDESTHALVGETKATFRAPMGKKIKNPKIKSWDFMSKLFYVAFAIILPLLLAGAAAALISFTQLGDSWKYILYIAPFAAAIIVAMIAINYRFGLDERGSGMWGWFFLWIGLALGVCALLVFIFPDFAKTNNLPVYAGYSILGASAVLGIASAFIKVKRKKFYFVIQGILLLVVIGAAVMLALRSMNGVI